MSSDINVQTFSGKVNITSNLLVGSTHLFVDTTNNRVGLVTVNPDAGLHVNSNAYVDADFRVGPSIVMNETSGRITAGSFVGDGSGITSVNSDSGSWVNGTDTVYLSTIGDKVGIGVNPPLYKLDVDGDINFTGALKYQGSDYVSTPWTIHTSPDALSYTAGNIGIGGAASTTNTLKVHGTVEATGFTGIQVGDVPTLDQNTTGSAGYATTAGTITSQANSATITASASADNSATIVRRNSSGYIYANYFNTNPNNVDSGVTKVCVETGNDGFIRHGTQAGVRSFLGLGAYAYKGDSRYNIHDGWLRENGDNDFVRLYGNSRSMVFRTDGTTQYSSNGGYPFVWLYGGDATGNRRMLINTSGQLWMSNYGWLHDKFAYKAGSTAQNFSSKECYVQGWVRTNGNSGHYWEGSSNGSGWHIYPKDRADMYMRTGSGNGGLAFCIANTTVRGYIHCTTSNQIGFLNSSRSWALRVDNSRHCQLYHTLGVDNDITCSARIQSGQGARIYGTETTYDYTNAQSDYLTNGGSVQVEPPNLNYGLYVERTIRAAGITVLSDRRIKSNIVDINDTTALDQVRLLKPKYYEYVDKIKKGSSSVIGFIAQEVKEVIPRAVYVADGDIPNIYEIVTISSNNTVTFTNFNTSNLEGTNCTLIAYLAKDKREEVTITEVVDEHTVRVEEDMSEWGAEVFVWGQKVDNFHHLNKDYIWTVATAALQEVDRQLQAEKTKTYELQQKVELLEMSHGALVERIEALEKL